MGESDQRYEDSYRFFCQFDRAGGYDIIPAQPGALAQLAEQLTLNQ